MGFCLLLQAAAVVVPVLRLPNGKAADRRSGGDTVLGTAAMNMDSSGHVPAIGRGVCRRLGDPSPKKRTQMQLPPLPTTGAFLHVVGKFEVEMKSVPRLTGKEHAPHLKSCSRDGASARQALSCRDIGLCHDHGAQRTGPLLTNSLSFLFD